jgi:DNA-binding transcriptional MocR family regulator
MNAPLHPTIALLQSSSLTSVVQQELERRILQGELAPGDKLIEAALAESLGVSRGPVREAFRMLEEAGLVRRRRTAASSCATSRWTRRWRSSTCAPPWTKLVGRQLAEHITPEQLRRSRPGRRDGTQREGR